MAISSEKSGLHQDTARQLTALRHEAARIQHDLNNPLAALLAEVQLLSLDPELSEEFREPVKRMVELTRRVIATVRQLDAVRAEPGRT